MPENFAEWLVYIGAGILLGFALFWGLS